MFEFLSSHSLYIVLSIALICWAGIFLYLTRIEKKLIRLEEAIRKEVSR